LNKTSAAGLLISVSIRLPALLNRAISSLVSATDVPGIEAVAFANSASGFPAEKTAKTIADVTNKMLREGAHRHKRSLHAWSITGASWKKFVTGQLDQPPLTEALKRGVEQRKNRVSESRQNRKMGE
jgi:hypothetical protein